MSWELAAEAKAIKEEKREKDWVPVGETKRAIHYKEEENREWLEPPVSLFYPLFQNRERLKQTERMENNTGLYIYCSQQEAIPCTVTTMFMSE